MILSGIPIIMIISPNGENGHTLEVCPHVFHMEKRKK